MDELIRTSSSLTLPRFGAVAVGLLALIACLLALIGVYAALAFTVARQSLEIGVRMALGARRADVRRGVLLRGLRLAGLGMAIGLGIALAGGRVLESTLYGIRPWDPATLGQVALLVLGAAGAAALAPAWRATRVDPMETLRRE
jgi:ABC-type antimicrobial peptide transport system permease subunit